MQLAEDARADVAEPGHDHVVADRPVVAAHRAGKPGSDHRGGGQRQEGQSVESKQELRDLLRGLLRGVGDRRPGRIEERQVERVSHGVAHGRGEQGEADAEDRDQARERGAEPVPEQHPEQARNRTQRVTARPGQRIARRAVGRGQHELRAGILRGHQAGRAPTGLPCPLRCIGGHAADHVLAPGVLTPRHVERAARQADVAGRRLAQGGRDEGRRRHRGL